MFDLLTLILGGIVAAGMAFLFGRHTGKRDERETIEREIYNDTIKRMDAGRDAVRDGRERGNPDERLRRNDGQY